MSRYRLYGFETEDGWKFSSHQVSRPMDGYIYLATVAINYHEHVVPGGPFTRVRTVSKEPHVLVHARATDVDRAVVDSAIKWFTLQQSSQVTRLPVPRA